MRFQLPSRYVEKGLKAGFGYYGRLVGRHPLPFVLAPLLLTLVLGVGLAWVRLETDLRMLFTPVYAPSKLEQRVETQWMMEQDDADRLYLISIMFTIRNPAQSMLEHNRSAFVFDMLKFINDNFTYEYRGERYRFGSRLCDPSYLCKLANKPMYIFLTIHLNQNLSNNPNMHMNFPFLELFGQKIGLAMNIGGVTKPANGSWPTDAKVLTLNFVVEPLNGIVHEEFIAFEQQLEKTVMSMWHPPDIEVVMYGPDMAFQAVADNVTVCLPFVSITLVLLAMLAIVCALTGDRLTGKVWEAICGLISCFLAIISTFGLMSYLGVAINSTVAVMPFLALAIGIDDTFIALSAWHLTDNRLPAHERLSMAMSESATAITVSSLTDVLLFGLCAISSTPAITIFSAYTASAMAFDYIYQLTFFAAVMAYGGRREQRGKDCCCFWRPLPLPPPPPPLSPPSQPSTLSHASFSALDKKLALLNADAQSDREPIVYRLVRGRLAPLLNRPCVKMGLLVLYILYLVVAYQGVRSTRIDMSSSKSVLDTSKVRRYFELRDQYLVESLMVTLYVRQPPDFRNRTETEELERFVDTIETAPFAHGPDSTYFFYRKFRNYVQYLEYDEDQFYEFLKQYLRVAANVGDSKMVHWHVTDGTNYTHDPNATVSSFMATTLFSNDPSAGWNGRVALLKIWRNITASFPQFRAVLFEPENWYVDQYNILDDETLQQVGVALLAMTVAAAVFIPHVASLFWIGFTLLSMDFGVIGFLMLWGCDLDPVSMINIVMSLDFAVEYSAHICHRYYASEESSPAEKLVDSLTSIGLPVLQGAMAAVVAIVPLCAVPSYVVRVFFRTVVLAVTLGLFHGLLLLPVIMSTFTSETYFPAKSVARLRRAAKKSI